MQGVAVVTPASMLTRSTRSTQHAQRESMPEVPCQGCRVFEDSKLCIVRTQERLVR
jgi:hypothetical protein